MSRTGVKIASMQKAAGFFMNVFSKNRDSVGLTYFNRCARALLYVTMLLSVLVPVSSAMAQEDPGRSEQREAMRQANRERWMQRRQEMDERNQQRDQMWQHRNQLGIPRQFDPNSGFPPERGPENWRERGGRMTPEERQALRRQIQEAGRSVYPVPPPSK